MRIRTKGEEERARRNVAGEIVGEKRGHTNTETNENHPQPSYVRVC